MSRLSSRIFLAPPLNRRNNGGTDRRTGLGGRRRFRGIEWPWFRPSARGLFILLAGYLPQGFSFHLQPCHEIFLDLVDCDGELFTLVN